jgi:hypothetical protein
MITVIASVNAATSNVRVLKQKTIGIAMKFAASLPTVWMSAQLRVAVWTLSFIAILTLFLLKSGFPLRAV